MNTKNGNKVRFLKHDQWETRIQDCPTSDYLKGSNSYRQKFNDTNVWTN